MLSLYDSYIEMYKYISREMRQYIYEYIVSVIYV